MRNLTNPQRALIVLALLFGLANAGRAQDPWRDPLEPSYEIDIESILPGEPVGSGVDPCSCLRELRACLISASLNLGRCLSRARNSARQALCYLKFELDILLCLERAGACELTCRP